MRGATVVYVCCVAAGTSPSVILTNGNAWPATMVSGNNDPVLDLTLTFQPARRPPARSQQPALVDPWMPSAITPSRAAAWPAQMRRFRGDV